MNESPQGTLSTIQAKVMNAIFGKQKKRNLSWSAEMQPCEIGGYFIQPLTTSRQLRAEGRAMRHCIGRYDELCHEDLVRVFSIRDMNGDPIATMSLIRHENYWRIEQVKGLQNAEVLENNTPFYDGESTVLFQEQTEIYFISQEILRCQISAWHQKQDGETHA